MSGVQSVVEPADLQRDGPDILVINNAAVPAVNLLDLPRLEALVAMGWLDVVRRDDVVAGFALTMPAGRPYDSLNYRWFDARFDSFLYVDRVVVAEAARGTGVGRLLYEAAIERARALSFPRVLSEVNVDPPNPQSMAFHARLGFGAVEERLNEAEGKTVAMMVRPL
ncbi:GNAT family N-acetyltransferase [Acuticoccus mangrovi]|uniref:GNAT family N-acetyltransferase n=1 Tax=Acuticoccus mangrovi TaxID=2796142 RepID=A0A934IJN6_9HYPH|nr:GNAT family N-acetyltransferase [Acuticoccus mangrovi]MBJ3774992.1 GNAT family N-acetyltransferase [Acuticoccus mangrovi]